MSDITPPEIRAVAKQVLTPRQLDTYRLAAQGWSLQRIAFAQDVSKSTVASTLNRAKQKIELEVERRANGQAVA
jgi:DNA-binding CsgD family transcriptional regulator